VPNNPKRPRENSLKSGLLSDLLIVLLSFSFFMAVASLVGSFVPALEVGNCWMWTRDGCDWRAFWTILINGIASGVGLGALCGLFQALLVWLLKADPLNTHADRSLKMLRAPLFFLGAGNGVLVAILTASRFHEKWICNWWGHS